MMDMKGSDDQKNADESVVNKAAMETMKEKKKEANAEEKQKSTKDLCDMNTFEDLLELVGTRGRWNVLFFMVCAFSATVAAFHSLSYQFLGATPDYWCRVDTLKEAGWTQEQIFSFAIPIEESSGKRAKCQMYDRNYTQAAALGYEAATAAAALQPLPAAIPCYARDFNLTQYKSTVTTEWDLVCERRALYSTTQAAAQVGRLFGSFFLGYVIDTFGRWTTVMWCCAVAIVSGFASAVSPNVETYIFLKVVITASLQGTSLGTYVLLMETSGTKERGKMGTLAGLSWCLGYMIIPGIAYLIRDWNWLQGAFAVPSLLFILYYWLLPKSPRWQIHQGRHEEALKVLKWAARVNGRTLPPDPDLLAVMRRLEAKACIEKEVAAGGGGRKAGGMCEGVVNVLKDFFVVLRLKSLRQRALVMFCCWFCVSMVYYGISLNATNISANIYLYVFLGGVTEIPCYIFMGPIIEYFGRVKVLSFLFLICALAIFILALFMFFYPDAPVWMIMIFSLSGKMAITAAFTLIWMFTLELFPTMYRSLVTGQASFHARVGSISAPYVNDLLGDLVVWAPSAVFGVASLVASGLSLLLPETRGCGMPEGCTFEKRTDDKGKDNLAYLSEIESQSKEPVHGGDAAQFDATQVPENAVTKL